MSKKTWLDEVFPEHIRRSNEQKGAEGEESTKDTLSEVFGSSITVSETKAPQPEKESTPEEPKVEEPKIEEPKIEEPKIEEAQIEETKVEKPKVEEPKVEEPKIEEPKVEEPKVEESEAEHTRIFSPASEEEEKERENSAAKPEAEPEKTEDGEENGDKLSFSGNVFDWIKTFLLSLVTVLFIFTLLFRGVTVSGSSMLPTLEDGDYLIISDLFYTPQQGDIVVVQSPHYKDGTEPLIKRIIATGGQTVRINFKTWQVWVDGVEISEPYILYEEGFTMNMEDLRPDENMEAELVVEEGHLFVMGDHRNDSLDSRSEMVGQIHERYVMGRVVLRLFPLQEIGRVE